MVMCTSVQGGSEVWISIRRAACPPTWLRPCASSPLCCYLGWLHLQRVSERFLWGSSKKDAPPKRLFLAAGLKTLDKAELSYPVQPQQSHCAERKQQNKAKQGFGCEFDQLAARTPECL